MNLEYLSIPENMSKRYRSQCEGASTASIGNTLNIKWFYVLNIIWINTYNKYNNETHIYDKWIHKYMEEKDIVQCQLKCRRNVGNRESLFDNYLRESKHKDGNSELKVERPGGQ